VLEPALRLQALAGAVLHLEDPPRELVHKIWLQEDEELAEIRTRLTSRVDRNNFSNAFDSPWDVNYSLVFFKPFKRLF
jgi:hypothetical protein